MAYDKKVVSEQIFWINTKQSFVKSKYKSKYSARIMEKCILTDKLLIFLI